MNIADLHQDLAFSSMRSDVINGLGQSSINELKKFDSSTVFSVVFPHINTWNETAETLTKKYHTPSQSTSPLMQLLIEQVKFYYYVSRSENVPFISKSSDLSLKGLKLLMALEGTDVLTDPFDVFLLKRLGFRSIGLTWNYDTKFAASCMSVKDYGLTGAGVEMVKLCNNNGMVVDLGHSSRNTILDACEISTSPVVFSHGNVKGVFDHIRNIDDKCIEAISDTGGIIGITAIPQTLGAEPAIEDMVKHMDYVGERFGWEHVALGTDFLGISTTPKGFESVDKIADLADLLGNRSDQVLWKNAQRVLEQILDK
ncbi:membrane dipeptidase [Oxyplasma meridianum]|uniref:Membrane dipeptidase n=1 Tax=Oxyplasma meridianum TaxID=3073602 RepID=A0AAX4NFL2_9ARCH